MEKWICQSTKTYGSTFPESSTFLEEIIRDSLIEICNMSGCVVLKHNILISPQHIAETDKIPVGRLGHIKICVEIMFKGLTEGPNHVKFLHNLEFIHISLNSYNGN